MEARMRAVVVACAFAAATFGALGCGLLLGDLSVSLIAGDAQADALAPDGGPICADGCGGRCGKLIDACGTAIDCGGCPNGLRCGGGGANVCGTGACTPSCALKACGASDGCDGVCDGDCPTGERCVSGICGCDPSVCTGCCNGVTCEQGLRDDACGHGGAACRVCTKPLTCGGGANGGECGCTPSCAGAACGQSDGCGGTCATGTCPNNQSCVAGACVCTAPLTACGPRCVDLTSDDTACGSCTKACPNGSSCTSSACVARIGNVGVTTAGSFTPNYLLGQAIVVPNAATLTKLAANSGGSGPTGRLALYTSVGGTPASLVAQTALFSVANGANEISIGAPVPLAAGTYWMVGDYSATAPIAMASAGSVTTKYIAYSYASAPPNPWAPAPTTYTAAPIGYYLVVTE
jgi:hypothetical protein